MTLKPEQTWLHSFPASPAAGLSIGDLADSWICGACKVKAVRSLAGVPERPFAAELIQSLALSRSALKS